MLVNSILGVSKVASSQQRLLHDSKERLWVKVVNSDLSFGACLDAVKPEKIWQNLVIHDLDFDQGNFKHSGESLVYDAARLDAIPRLFQYLQLTIIGLEPIPQLMPLPHFDFKLEVYDLTIQTPYF